MSIQARWPPQRERLGGSPMLREFRNYVIALAVGVVIAWFVFYVR